MSRLTKTLIILYLVVTAVFNFRSLGILVLENPSLFQLGGDSGRYTRGALNLIAGRELDYSQRSYIGYLGVVAVVFLINTGPVGVVFVQLLFHLIAAICLFLFIDKVLSNRLAAILAVFLFLTSFELVKWTTYLLPDSVYFSFVLLFSLAALIPRSNLSKIFLSLGLAITCSLLRPNGFIVLIGWFVYVLLPQVKNTSAWIPGFLALLFGIWLITSLGSSAESRRIYEFASNGEVIWSYRDYLFTTPSPAIPINNSIDLVIYFASHPTTFLKLFTAKVFIEVARVRPYLPLNFNLFLLFYLLPLYYFALRTWAQAKYFKTINILIFLILSHLGFVGLTYADWDGRFLIHVLPLILIYSSLGISQPLQPLRPVSKLH